MTTRLEKSGEDGFVVIAVVMVVLALTILGLSLFSLSSFEAQFMRRSLDQEKAFHAATGAVERVKFNLTRSGRLETSWFGYPDAIVDSARAWQWKGGVMVENGALDPGIVHIRVHTRIGEASQTVSGSYLINAVDNTYRRLVTTSGAVNILVDPPPGTDHLSGTVLLEGIVYENSAASGWVGSLMSPPPDSIRHGLTWIGPPAVQPMFDAHYATAQGASLDISGLNPTWAFDANGQQPGYFHTPLAPIYNVGGTDYSFLYQGGVFHLGVRGPVVLLAPKGFYAFSEVQIDRIGAAGPNDCLVIIAGPNNGVFFPGHGIVFEHGIYNPDNIPIILVSPAPVIVRRGTDASPPAPARVLNYLTVYSGAVEFAGFESYLSTLRHPIGHANDLPGGLVDRLSQWGALPGGSIITSPLQLIAGSWQETKN